MARHMKPINCGPVFARLRRGKVAEENGNTLKPSFRILWKIIGDCVPRRAISDESMKLRPDSGINIERTQPDRYLRPVRPIAAE